MNPVDPYRLQALDLDALVAAAGALVRRARLSAEDARISAVPDARTVRYYQSLGVMDRPSSYDGRRAIYGLRHLLQIVAAKLLQSQGLSLSQVQAALAGATDAALEAAVAEALGTAPPALPPAPTGLIAVRLAPGVHLSIDPTLVSDPDQLIALLTRALHGGTP